MSTGSSQKGEAIDLCYFPHTRGGTPYDYGEAELSYSRRFLYTTVDYCRAKVSEAKPRAIYR